MKKFKLIALVIVLVLSTACAYACKKAHVCEFGDWSVVTAETCEEDGLKQRVCIAEGCDAGIDGAPAVEEEAIPAAHVWGEFVYDEDNGPSTCIHAARDVRTCSRCDEVEYSFHDLAAHTFEGSACSVCGYDPAKSYTYKTYTSVSPSNWNELTYQDNNDTQIMSYIGSPFFESDFKFDADGKIVPGQFEVEYSFATKLEDITAEYANIYGPNASGYAWKITIRDDGKWENGDPIVAGDFVYSMKEQLNPLFLHYRADSFYAGSVNILNAKEYVKQGQEGVFSAADIMSLSQYNADEYDSKLIFSLADPNANSKAYDASVECALRTMMGFPASYNAAQCASHLKDNYVPTLDLAVVAEMEGKTLAEIKANEQYAAEWAKLIGWWQTEPGEEIHFCIMEGAFPELSFDQVGIFAPSNTELVILLTDSIQFLDEDGNLTYHCFYEFSSLPLVHKATYEKCKIAPETEDGLWTTNYNSSLETTMSWGPYKLTTFQAGKYYVLEKNNYWYGYNMDKYAGQYQTNRVECETITSYNTAFMKFEKGELTGIGIDVSKAPDYKDSDRAYFTPDDFVGSMQLQSNKEALKQRETEGVNKTLLTYSDFRKAISLSFDRVEYNRTCTTSSQKGFGLFNSMHYYDVANGGVYRNTDVAKNVLCDVYGIDVSEYDSLDDAYAAITGYDMNQAKVLLNKAYAEALAAGDIKATDTVILTVGTAADTESTRRIFEFIKKSLETLAEGTDLDGRLTAEFNTSYGSAWANDFRAGAYDICTGGYSGAAWNPGYFLLAYLSPDYMYSQAWDTASEMVTITVPGVKEEDGKYVITNNAEDSFTATLPAYGSGNNDNWYGMLNNGNLFGQGSLADDFRLVIIGALEKLVLEQYYSVPISYSFGASLISYQVEYLTYEYNTFNGYGGIQYMTYYYSDAQWAEYLKNNTLDYTK